MNKEYGCLISFIIMLMIFMLAPIGLDYYSLHYAWIVVPLMLMMIIVMIYLG